jgi:hypothetical protein
LLITYLLITYLLITYLLITAGGTECTLLLWHPFSSQFANSTLQQLPGQGMRIPAVIVTHKRHPMTWQACGTHSQKRFAVLLELIRHGRADNYCAPCPYRC